MFTGIVQTLGRVRRIQANPFGARLIIDPAGWDHRPAAGDSVCVNGVCLTHTEPDKGDEGCFAFDVIRETLDRTNLGDLRQGGPVNLEPSLTASTPMGGHFVQGHVDAVAKVVHVVEGEEEWRITHEVDRQTLRCIIPKGSVALDGVSMTIASVDVKAGRFDVALIPTTIEVTTLGTKRVGDTTNIETDMIARAIVHQLTMMSQGVEEASQGVTLEGLRKAGFVG